MPLPELRLRLSGAARHFPGMQGDRGVGPLDFELLAGETVGICGASGCGKSTLLRLMARLERADQGDVWWADGTRIAFVFQEPRLLPWKTALDNVALVLGGGVDRHARARAALEEVGLGPAVDNFPAQLSGGMRQRVNLARALVVDPSLLLLDEPFSSVDYYTRQELLVLVRNRIAARRMSAVFVSHDVREIARLCHRALVLRGRPGSVAGILSDLLPPMERDQDIGQLAQIETLLLEWMRGEIS